MISVRPLVCIAIPALAGAVYAASEPHPRIGESETVYTLANENTDIRGLAFDDISPEAPRLFVLDRSRRIFTYRRRRTEDKRVDALKLLGVQSLPVARDGSLAADPRGLSFTREAGNSVLYFLDWKKTTDAVTSRLWRYSLEGGTASIIDLSLYPFRIGDREVLDLAYDNGTILVCFDASGYTDRNLRAQRGIIRLKWNQAQDGKLEFVDHLPDSGHLPSHGLAVMEFEGARYLWGTVGNDSIYCADAVTGRGLFHFDRPSSTGHVNAGRGLCFGSHALWMPEDRPGADRVHCVNVTRNLDAFEEGPRILRHLTMTIHTEPEARTDHPGKVFHYYSRPYAHGQMRNQGIYPETEKVDDTSDVENATVKRSTYDPAGDVSSRQTMQLVEYADAPARAYSSKYEIDLWTQPCRRFIYPHRVNKNRKLLKGTNYLEDDPDLYNLRDRKTYTSFIKRVRAHIESKYSVPADMDNPYWAARNALEYVQDHYYYPSRPKRKPAAVDYHRQHYDANPGNLKIELSSRPYDKSQIIACSGTSVMLAGAMRHLGIPARWLGTGTQQKPDAWDTNRNGLLDEGEVAPCTNGHRYTQVWLGSHYGWVCFDATPSKPDFNDYDPPPPIRSQWRFMNRAAAGHLKDRRIVFNVGSKLFRPLYREFEYDEKLAVDNNCGGDQRYNLQGRFEKPARWKLASSRIQVTNVCFVTNVIVSGPKKETKVTWKLEGHWDKDPGATVSLYLRLNGGGQGAKEESRLAGPVPCGAKSVLVDLSGYRGKRYCVVIRKDGDSQTGGCSEPFDLR